MSRVHIIIFLILSSIFASITQPSYAQVPQDVYRRVIADLNQQRYVEAEALLKPALERNPRDARALDLMGVILDAQKRYAAAEQYYKQALRISPHSSSLLNNLGNHYMAQGERILARAAYLKVIQTDPRDANANFQLARISLEAKQGHRALHYLTQLGNSDQGQPPIQFLRAQALMLIGDSSAAEKQLVETLKQSGQDPRVSFSVGILFAKWKKYKEAEEAFSAAQSSAPSNFDVLYNLGLSALDARDLDKAGRSFQDALKQRPNNVDCLVGLAKVRDLQGHESQAATILFRSIRRAPDRPDLLKLLAQVTTKLGLYGVAITTYSKYLKLRPEDAEATRQRAFDLALDHRLRPALKGLQQYVYAHPRDPVGFYELALAESLQYRSQALQNLDKALTIDPHMTAAHLERARLLQQGGRIEDAVKDLKTVLAVHPNNFYALDELGECYLGTGKTAEAVETLKRAADLAQSNSVVLLHYSQALMRARQQRSAKLVLARLESLESKQGPKRLRVSMRDYLSWDPSLQGVHNLVLLRKIAATEPRDMNLQLHLAKALLSQGNVLEALKIFQRIKVSTSNRTILAESGEALLDARQYKPARAFLSQVASPSDPKRQLDLAIAVYHDGGAANALAALDKIPVLERDGDFFLLRAQLLDAMGKFQAAAAALNQAFQLSPRRGDLYFQAALFLAKHGRFREMVKLLTEAEKLVPNDPKLELTLAIAYEMMQRHEEAKDILARIESRWPEWYLPYEIDGIILSIELMPAKAESKLETAVALGADNSLTYFYLAWAIITANYQDVDAAQKAIDKAVSLNPKDPYIQALAGKIAYRGKCYQAALQHLHAALTIWPNMVEAIETLSATYRAMGEREKSIKELKLILRIKEKEPTGNQLPPFPIGRELFAVQ